MNQEQVLGIIRHTLTFVGGILVMKGFIDETMMEAIIGSATTLVGLIWSAFIKKT
jgi:hypothetical protein